MNPKLKFRISEIPEGKSRRTVSLGPEDAGFEDLDFHGGKLEVRFEKAADMINVEFDVEGILSLVCDRSLESFEHRIRGNYMVVFKPEAGEGAETEKSRVKSFNMHEMALDIGQEVRDTILLEVPVKKLHPRFLDDRGVPVEFETRSFGSAGKDEDRMDPRWEALKKLKR